MKKTKILAIIIIILSLLFALLTIAGIIITAIYCSRNILHVYIFSIHIVDLMYLILGTSLLLIISIALLHWKYVHMTKETPGINCWFI